MIYPQKYDIGENIVFNYWGDLYYPCTVLKFYPERNRYRILYLDNQGEREVKVIIREEELKRTKRDFIASKMNDLTKQVGLLQNKIAEYQEYLSKNK
jgi:hypothetical protein